MPGRPTNLFAPASFLWLLRLAWTGLAVAMGFALDDTVASVAWWATVAVVVVALTVTGPLGLTVVRVVTPATAPAALLAWSRHGGTWLGLGATVLALLVTVVAMSAEAGEAMVQGSAYGEELRFPLRVPAAMLLPVAIMWVLWCDAVLGAVVVLSHRAWVLGAVIAVVAVALTWFLGPRFHRLSSRWLVLVPAGVVVHDHLLMAETLMVQRSNVAAVHLALAGSEAFDLTGPTGGHALDVEARETVLAVFPASAKEPYGRAVHLQSFLVAPSRPGRALQAMAAAHLPVG
ncbi:MAG: hypothetical protein RJA49_299 [Actinomycetota bacterium]